MPCLRNRLGVAAAVLALAFAATASFAQDERGGDRGNRGDRGTRGGGFPSGGFRSGPSSGGFRGGPPGGGFSPIDLLRRFDRDGNGMIDPPEGQGPAAGLLQRLASVVPGIDLAKPVPIDKLAQAMERLRQQRDASSGQGNSGRGPSGSAATTIEPLVPGFGIDEVLPPAPGFGAEAELFTVKVTDADNREAESRFQRYDTNRDGFLDKGELARGRWSEDPLIYDRNHDGRLTASEMAVRYAQRRISVEASRSTQTASSSNDPRANRFAGGDRGGFGRGGFGAGGVGDANARSFFSRRDPGAGDGPAVQDPSSGSSSAKVDTRKSYRVKTVTERLPAGLPDWFARHDANADGQVAMAEFSTTWTDSVLQDFGQFDLNHDGMITPSEALSAVNNGAVRGSTSPSSSTAAADGTSTTAASTAASRPVAAESGSGEALQIDPRYLAYYQKLLTKYDTNKDGALVAGEWQAMSKDPSAADSNGDGRIVVNELAAWSMKR